MGVSWTDDQRKVIDLRKRNILVSAAAGSGKTAVLVERIKELILDKENPVAMDELLVVTFTKAAAAQMRDRIGAAIENELLGQPQNMYLQQQLALLYHAQITTIDSFCLYVIRNHFHEISLDPNFRIADEGELKLLAGEVLDNLLEQEYGKGDEGFLQLADIYASGRNDDGLKALVLQLYEYARSYPFPKEWLHHCEEGYCYETVEELMSSALFESLLTYTSHVADGIAQSIRRALRICQEEDGPYMYEKALKSDMEQIEGFLACQGYEAVLKWLKTVNWATLKADRSFQGSKEKQEYVKAARNGWKKTIDTLQKKYFFLTPEELAAQLIRIRPLVGEMVQLTLHYMEAFAARKRERNIVDFGDLEHFALEILVDGETKEPTAAAKEFQHAYAQIMIDEYQDSNYVQETILRAVSREASGENNIFMVGDVKQSIYRFRLARPELFMEKYDTYSLEDSDKQRVDLHQNFRSRNEVLDITNHIFAAIMHKSLGNVEYDKAAALYPGASYPAMEHMFEPEILLADTKDELLEDVEHADKASLEAMLIATKLREMMDSQLVTDEDSKELRRMRYGDVVILLRSLSGYADTFVEVLTDYGIPVHTASKTGYFSAIEVQTVLNYLRILDNPFQDIPLAAVLRSPVGGFTEEELAKIRIAEPDGLFSEAFFKGITKQEYDQALSEKTEAFLRVFEMLRAETADRPIHEILMMVLEETGYGRLAAAMPGGRQRQANLEMLVEKAIAYEKTSYRGLFHFIRYIDELQKYDVDFGEAELVSENEDAVRIMSIHKSKGLEFPVVFVSALGKRFNKQDIRSRMILHPSLGLGLDETDRKRHLKIASIQKRILANQNDLEGLGEELRILYVALTRAKEKLILTGTAEGAAELIEEYRLSYEGRSRLSFLELVRASSYLEWVLGALLAGEGRYRIQTLSVEDMLVCEAQKQVQDVQQTKELALTEEEIPDEVREFVESRLSYQYPYEKDIDLQLKYSVSELKHRAIQQLAENTDSVEYFPKKQIIPYVPAFIDEAAKDNEVSQGALRGTAVHRALECLDFAALTTETLQADIETQLAGMQQDGRITEEQRRLVSTEQLVLFLKSGIGQRMRAAAARKELYREKPFVLGREQEGSEMILVQGIIDVYWMEDGQICLLDYKTDRVENDRQLADLYREQLLLYAEALEKVYPMKVKERYLYSFHLHQAVPV